MGRSRVLDLHTSEVPIHAGLDVSIQDAGLEALAENGVMDLYAVNRGYVAEDLPQTRSGKNSIFRDRSHWSPPKTQSDRGMAMMLSSLRVFCSIVQDMDKAAQDAVLHVFDLLTKFPPALRSLRLLTNGKTPKAVESAALSNALFEILDSFMPSSIVGIDQSRLFEGSRLLFGLILEKARVVKLSNGENEADLPYLSKLNVVDIKDAVTGEPIM